MKSNCEAVVEHAPLLTAGATVGPPLNLMPSTMVRISPAPDGIRVETASMTAELAAKGKWTRVVEVDRNVLRRLLSRYRDPTVSLLHVAGVLMVNRTSIAAGACKVERTAGRPAHGKQLALGIDRSVTDAAHDPLRPRRGQLNLLGLPLFGSPRHP